MPRPQVMQIARIGLIVADLDAACAFYIEALGFVRLGGMIDGHRTKTAVLRLGRQEIELTAFDPPGAPYPQPRAANDPWFQHFAIVVSDMDAAYGRLSRYGQQPISEGGPQLLPPSTGSVTAYKFRDPDGHPLELSFIPGSDWLKAPPKAEAGPFLGIDHSALAVRDLDASVAFYTDVLGLSLAGRFLNQGPEQDRLDGLKDVQLDIVALETADAGPHIELLHYRSPRADAEPAEPAEPAPSDIQATRLIVGVHDLDALTARLDAALRPWSPVDDGSDHRAHTRDLDEHLIEFFERPA